MFLRAGAPPRGNHLLYFVFVRFCAREATWTRFYEFAGTGGRRAEEEGTFSIGAQLSAVRGCWWACFDFEKSPRLRRPSTGH